VVDSDTIEMDGSGNLELELEAGEHVLRFFPYHTADAAWYHRYLIYPFSVGSDGRRTIDLTRCETFTFASTPQAAVLSYRDRYLGRTPGEYLLLTGEGDSVLMSMPGFESEVFDLDNIAASGNLNVHLVLDPQIAGLDLDDEKISAYEYHTPARKLLAPDLMISLTSGVAMLALGSYFNQKADDHYDRYQKLLGPSAREKAYSDMKRNDRLSKLSFVAGDAALGVFGYLLVKKIIFPAKGESGPERDEREGLSMSMSTTRAQFSFKF
jgi:hypothetical protein